MANGAYSLLGGVAIRGTSTNDPGTQPNPSAPLPIHWWGGESNASDSIGTAHGTVVGGLTYAEGRVRKAFEFDGNSEITFGPDAGNFGTNDFTIEFWIKTTTGGTVLNKREVCALDSLWDIRSAIQAGFAQDQGGTLYTVLDQVPVADGQWHHFAWVRAGRLISTYRDGALFQSITIGGVAMLKNAALLRAGNAVCPEQNGPQFKGLLDEIKLYHTALTAAQVTEAFAHPPQPSDTPTPVHWWAAESNANDQAGSAHGTVTGDLVYTEGRIGRAFQFDGVNDEISFGTEAGNFGTNDFTVELWIKTPVDGQVLSKREICNVGSFWDIRGSLEVFGSGLPGDSVSMRAAIDDDRWHHLALVRASTNVFTYRDGRLVDSGSTVTPIVVSNTAPLRAGFAPCVLLDGTLRYGGLLDEVKIYHLALTPAQVAVAAGLPEPPLVQPLPPLLASARTKVNLLVERGVDPTRFKWQIEPDAGRSFTAADLEGVDLETSVDLKIWTIIPGAVRLVGGKVEIADPEAFAKRSSFYRIAYRSPASRGDPTGGLIPLSQVPQNFVTAAEQHIAEFLEPAETRDEGPEENDWVGVMLAPTARHLFEPTYKSGQEPAFVELKVISRTGEPRGYILVSLTDAHRPIVEFSTEGMTKTERALAEMAGSTPHRIMRYNATFLAMEDAGGDLLGSLGTWPALPDTEPASQEPRVFEGAYDSETGEFQHLPRRPLTGVGTENYAQLRSGFANNPTRVTLATLRKEAVASRLRLVSGIRTKISIPVGITQDLFTTETFTSVRVDVDDEEPSVLIEGLVRGFRATGLRPGADLVRARTRDGHVETFTITVTASGFQATTSQLTAFNNCRSVSRNTWTAGSGWHGDQRQYYQPKSSFWCPAVGCGPAAWAMLYGWWDANGVPSAFYKLSTGNGDADDFLFNYPSLRDSDAGKTVGDGHAVYAPNGDYVGWALSTEALVMHDIYNLCNTFCADGQGATEPSEMIDGGVEYIDRVVRNLGSPENTYGEQLVGAWLSYSYTDGYWLGMTDWQGGGVKVAHGIKDGVPGIVGLGDTLFDLHYALAYAYKRVDVYEGCGDDRELVDRTRWFKCNMGWGPNHSPEWHDAESVWFGLTADIWQKTAPHP